MRIYHYVGNDYDPYFATGLKLISYATCTFHIFFLTKKPMWSLCCSLYCLTFYFLSFISDCSFQVDYFNYALSFLWFWILVGKLIFLLSLELCFKQWGLVVISAVMVQVYLNDFPIDFQLLAFLYCLLVSGYVLFDLCLFPFWYYLCLCSLRLYGRLRSCVGLRLYGRLRSCVGLRLYGRLRSCVGLRLYGRLRSCVGY